jgi:tetratricopeptide (TPR) repeat protein
MHYNLGIAYKEMDLLEDAITEFQLAAKDPNRFPDCCNWLGICFREKGMAKLAVKWYQKGVDAAGSNTDQLLGLLYGLGEAYEEAGDLESSLDTFTDVYGLNSEYRDIAAKIKNLEEKLGQ